MLETNHIYCGDSKDKKHAHFYISVPMNNDELSFYHCKKCPAHGIVDNEVLSKIGCEDSSLSIEIIKHNTRVLKLPKYKSLKKINIYPLKNEFIREDQNNKYKLQYINNRIGSNYNYSDLSKLKIFLNLYDILNSNRLELTRHKMVGDNLDKYFIGFISYDNSYCGLRKIVDIDLHKSVNKRYINYSLVNKVDDRKNYYIIPSNIDILNPLPVRIHIAEGQFDILSIFHNLNNDNIYQNIYIACGGKGYLQTLEFILEEIGVINFEIHYYPDRDVNDYELGRDVLRHLENLSCNVFIHRNIFDGEKDYGVPLSKIKDSTIQVLDDSFRF